MKFTDYLRFDWIYIVVKSIKFWEDYNIESIK